MENFDSNSLFSSAFQFIPNDKQLIKLLQDRISSSHHGIPWSHGIKIRDVEVYGELTPHQIFAHSEFQERAVNGPAEGTRYCFTTLKRTKQGGKRWVRTTGGGTWKAQNMQEIHVDNTTIGLKRAFSFIPSKSGTIGPAEPGRWVMYEYTLIDSSIPSKSDIAICKIIKKALTKREREANKEDTEVVSDAKKIRTSSGNTDSSDTSTTLQAPLQQQPCTNDVYWNDADLEELLMSMESSC